MSQFFKAVWDRVVLSYKSTLVGVGAGVGFLLLDQFNAYVAALPGASPWLKAAAALALVVGASLRSKALPPVGP
jgi:hypothetical protein